MSAGVYGFCNKAEQSAIVKAASEEEKVVKSLSVEKTLISEIENVGPWLYDEGVKYAVQGTFPSYSFAELNEKADLIVEGKPTAILEEYMVDGDVPFTKFSFKVNKVHKGDKKEIEKEIEFLQDGNTVMVFDEHPLLEIGNKYILFLKISEIGDVIMVGGPNGKFEYKEELKAYTDVSGKQLNENFTPQ
ncbi:hypothetical protein B1B05_09420 [Domibacillus enclensis]|uniref:Uncharacterized protein n=1 Tax=Domibacillus enclensis TaxID=1017273 RepID=A0ABX4E7W3_9BACI|nr:hypothetical protein B1B05_09420 [Domibacillus enclensis]